MKTNRRRTRLVCPECGETARRCPPRRWVAVTGPRPRWSHPDGEPLCPVPGATGSRPADPHPAPPARRVRRRVPPPAGVPTAPVAGTGDTGPVYVVAGGAMVAVFTDPDSATVQHTVMVGANLDTITRTVRADQWPTIRAQLRATAPHLVIVDSRDRDGR